MIVPSDGTYDPLTRGFSHCVISKFNMINTHATVSKTTDGRTATWRFVDIDGDYAVIGDNRKIIPCRDINHMRDVYRTFASTKYGFTPLLVDNYPNGGFLFLCNYGRTDNECSQSYTQFG